MTFLTLLEERPTFLGGKRFAINVGYVLLGFTFWGQMIGFFGGESFAVCRGVEAAYEVWGGCPSSEWHSEAGGRSGIAAWVAAGVSPLGSKIIWSFFLLKKNHRPP